jgi:hypothetical protein
MVSGDAWLMQHLSTHSSVLLDAQGARREGMTLATLSTTHPSNVATTCNE